MSNKVASDEQLQAARVAFLGYHLAQLSYGVVRDYCQSADLLPGLASFNHDLKDQQRCWMLKAILSSVPSGSRLLEIGAGEPLIADMLGRLGYSVVAVDPYEGQGNGPVAIESYRETYTNLDYLVDWFGTELQGVPKSSIDCCYSISVLEHVPLTQIPEVVRAMQLFTKPGGRLIHAVDCVTAGPGADYHRAMVKKLACCLGLPSDVLEATLNSAATDPETYYLSAEAHNLWRGSTPYSMFPMRRCISVQIATEVPGC